MGNSHIVEIGGEESAAFFKALSSKTRLAMLEVLQQRPMGITSLADTLGISPPTVTRHIQELEAAGLVTTEPGQGNQATQKICRTASDRYVVAFEHGREVHDHVVEVEMPVGMYSLVTPTRPCGLACADALIGYPDDTQAFFLPERAAAQLLWTSSGFVEYVFPSRLPQTAEVTRLELSMEICSEAPDYDNDYPSDITLWINNVEVGTWTSPGDFGGKRGRLTPPWWSDTRTQFGVLKVWSVDDESAYVDGSLLSDRTLSDLLLAPRAPIIIRIGNKPDAQHAGGFNILGRGFGNYRQDIVLRLHYAERDGDRP